MDKDQGYIAKATKWLGALAGLIAVMEVLAKTPVEAPTLSSLVIKLLGRTPLQSTHPEMADTCWFLREPPGLWRLCVPPDGAVKQTLYLSDKSETSIIRCRSEGSATAKGIDLRFNFNTGQCTNEETTGAHSLECIEPDNLHSGNALMQCSSSQVENSLSYRKGIDFEIDNLSNTCWEHQHSTFISTLCTKEIKAGKSEASIQVISTNNEPGSSTPTESGSSGTGTLEANDFDWLWNFDTQSYKGEEIVDNGQVQLKCIGPVMEFNDVSIMCIVTAGLNEDDLASRDFMIYTKVDEPLERVGSL